MNIFKSAVVVVFTLMSFSASAASETHTGSIARIYLAGNGAVYLKLKNKTKGCTPMHSNHYYTLSPSHSLFEESYALLLAAAHADDVVSIRMDDAACHSSIFNSNVDYVLQNF